MTVVKGSKQYRVKVVSYNPWLRSAIIVGVMVAIAVAIVSGFSVGKYSGINEKNEVEAQRDVLLVVSSEAEIEVARLRQEVANLSLGSEVDQQAGEEVRGQVIELKAEIAAQKEDIGFYRSLMSPTKNERGLTIGSWDLFAASGERQFQYKLVMQQLATNHTTLSGVAGLTVVGQQNDVLTRYTLKDLSETMKYDQVKLKFKYFQTISGRIQLPESFEPDHIEVVAETTGKNSVKVDKKFGWFIQEG